MPLHPELNNFLVGVNIDDIISVVLRQSEYLSFAKKGFGKGRTLALVLL